MPEYLDKNGLRYAAKRFPRIEDIANGDAVMYGVEWDYASSSPECTRIGNATLHRTLPIHNAMRGCVLQADGTVPDGGWFAETGAWTGIPKDGSAGDVMVHIPRFWWKFETEGTKRRVKLSQYAIAGYSPAGGMYISAYHAALNRTTQQLRSVVNTTTEYRGGNNNTSYDSTDHSLLGMPATNLSRTAFRTAARKNRNASWNCMLYEAQKLLYWLFVVEYATLNSQKAFNAQPTAEGYRQGGLGGGVTNLDYGKWTTSNDNNPFVPCGYTDELGNGTGVKAFAMPASYGQALTTYANRYRGIENPFGHIWNWTDGVNVKVQADGNSEVWVCGDPAKFSDTGYDGYAHIGNEARTESFVKKLIFGPTGDIDALEVGGGSTTYHCDYHYTTIPQSGTALRGLLFGGGANDGSSAGLVYSHSAYAPSYANSDVGSRLCFIG